MPGQWLRASWKHSNKWNMDKSKYFKYFKIQGSGVWGQETNRAGSFLVLRNLGCFRPENLFFPHTKIWAVKVGNMMKIILTLLGKMGFMHGISIMKVIIGNKSNSGCWDPSNNQFGSYSVSAYYQQYYFTVYFVVEILCKYSNLKIAISDNAEGKQCETTLKLQVISPSLRIYI